MRTLTSSSSLCTNSILEDWNFCFYRVISHNRFEICCLASKKPVNVKLLHFDSSRCKILKPVRSSSSLKATEVKLDAAESQIQETHVWKTVHVRFQLQKECVFGEHFFIVGDDPSFGLWDPENAVPLKWSDGHTWTVDLDLPAGKPVEFKFILKGKTGSVLWQPGPNRVLKTWETNNTITIQEDWEEADLQKISEEEPMPHNQDKNHPATGIEMPMVAENLTNAQEEENTTPSVNIGLPVEPNVDALQEDQPTAMVAENIIYLREFSAGNLSHNVSEDKKDECLEEDTNLMSHEGVPVLVPGLTPLPTEESEEVTSDEDEETSGTNAAIGVTEVIEAESHDLLEPELDEKQEPQGARNQEEPRETLFSVNEEKVVNGVAQRHHQIEEEEKHQFEPKPTESNVLENNIQWGRRTLHKLLNSFRLF